MMMMIILVSWCFEPSQPEKDYVRASNNNDNNNNNNNNNENVFRHAKVKEVLGDSQ